LDEIHFGLLFSTKLDCLQTLNLDECELLEDSTIELIAKNCSKCLRKLSIQWNIKITNRGFSALLLKCIALEQLDATGLKNLQDECLFEAINLETAARDPQQALQQSQKKKGLPTTALRSLNRLSFQKCDFVALEPLERVLELFPRMEIIDYYGNQVE